MSERNAEREFVGARVSGHCDVIEFRREDVAEDTINFGAICFDVGNDDSDGGVGLLGQTGAYPARAGGEFSLLVEGCGEGSAGREWRLVEFVNRSSVCLNRVEERSLRWSPGVESHEQESRSESEVAVVNGGAESLGELGLREIAGVGTTALELTGPAGEGGCVGVAGEVLETAAASVVVQQEPCAGGCLCEGINGAKTGGSGV